MVIVSGVKWKGRIAGLLVLLTALAFLGCGNRAQDGVRDGGGPGPGDGEGREGIAGGESAGADGRQAGQPGIEAGDGIEADSGIEADNGIEVDNVIEAEGGIETGTGQDKMPDGTGNGEGSRVSQREEGMTAQKEEGAAESPWSGKRMSVCGDSISTFTGYIPDNYSRFYPEYGDIPTVEETWWMQVLERTGMELCSNASYSGSTVSGQSQDNHEGAYACGNQRIADLAGAEGSWPDVILILMGTNDFLYDIPIGSYDGTSQVQEGYIRNFSEAYGLMLDKMQMWYPDAQIYCGTIVEVSQWDDTGQSSPFRNGQELTVKNYNDCIKAVADAKGAEVIDVFGCGITYENAMEYTSDGVHPNAAGAALIADKVCEGLGVD